MEFKDKDGKPTIGFCLWCNQDFYTEDEMWEHTADGMKACPEFQRIMKQEPVEQGS
jgi:hypothetical protein